MWTLKNATTPRLRSVAVPVAVIVGMFPTHTDQVLERERFFIAADVGLAAGALYVLCWLDELNLLRTADEQHQPGRDTPSS